MARRLRCKGTGSGGTGCPTVHEDLDTGDVIFHGPPLTHADDLGQLQHLSPGEVAVVIPRHVVVDFAPKEMERVARIIGLDEFENLFRTFEHSAWRLESRRRYASDESTETYREFLATGSATWDPRDPYAELIRPQIENGHTISRVRILDEPPTAGQRYLLDNARRNSALGEEIKSLTRADADRLRLPAEDFWIFDSRLVAKLNFTDADELTDVELITEPAQVVRYSMARDAAWHHAVPHEHVATQYARDAQPE
ncbi:DUF6879 family protein [Streptomyces sp. NPDC048425]|uniref:DUF6879 family protein n=1 Tax=Streptomyces sp. NPDC048425 TaxID=3365548 RepID=UPI003715A246